MTDNPSISARHDAALEGIAAAGPSGEAKWPTCSVEDCRNSVKSKGMCAGHGARLARYGDPLAGPRKTGTSASILHRPKERAGAQPTYGAAHQRVKKARGRASSFDCVDCGRQAKDWSYNNQAPDERIGLHRGFLLAFSMDPMQYDPRCALCHTRFDLKAREEGA